MANQTISVAHRRALWAAYNYRCFYCEEHLRWDDLQVDHVIPRHLGTTPQKLASVLKDIGLPLGWELQADENLVPAHARCNTKKHGLLPASRQLSLWLTVTRERAPKIAYLREKYEEQSRSDLNRAKLETALASGWIREEDVREALASAQIPQDAAIPLTYGVELLDGPTIQELRPSEVDRLLDLPIRGGGTPPEGLHMVKGGGAERDVFTCNEYMEAQREGYYAPTTYDMQMEAFFIQTYGLLRAIRASRPASMSFIREPRVGICDLNFMPSDLLILFGEVHETTLEALKQYPTMQALVNAQQAKLISIGSDHLAVEFVGFITYFRELFRADLNGDGIEDVLISRYLRADHGTLGVGIEPVVLAKTSETDLFVMSEVLQPDHIGEAALACGDSVSPEPTR